MVVESDESDGTFAKLHPTCAVVTNIDPEHMDHYGSMEKLREAFEIAPCAISHFLFPTKESNILFSICKLQKP